MNSKKVFDKLDDWSYFNNHGQSKQIQRHKEALLQEGMQQLAQNGYHGTGIKKVLDAVNVPKGSFYHYFDSK